MIRVSPSKVFRPRWYGNGKNAKGRVLFFFERGRDEEKVLG